MNGPFLNSELTSAPSCKNTDLWMGTSPHSVHNVPGGLDPHANKDLGRGARSWKVFRTLARSSTSRQPSREISNKNSEQTWITKKTIDTQYALWYTCGLIRRDFQGIFPVNRWNDGTADRTPTFGKPTPGNQEGDSSSDFQGNNPRASRCFWEKDVFFFHFLARKCFY